MYRTLLILQFLTFSFAAMAQYQYVPMPLDKGQWRYRLSWTYQNQNPREIDDYMLLGSNTDTVINGLSYKRIFRRNSRSSGNSMPIQSAVANGPDYTDCFLREDNKKVYWWRWNGQENRDTLIYDFNRAVGDTLPTVFNMYPASSDFTYIIRVVDTIAINGSQRRRFKGTHHQFNQADTIEVIEGIGSNRGLIMNNLPGGYGMYNFTPEFHCYTDAGLTYSPNKFPCSYIWNSNTPVSVGTISQSDVNIRPNPFEAHIVIETPVDATLKIQNSTGLAVSSLAVSKGRENIDTDALAPGIYFITITDQNGRLLCSKKLFKQ